MPDASHVNPDTTAHFLLEMPLSKARDVERAIRDANVWFEAEKAITGHTDQVGVYSNHTGHNLQDVINEINRHEWDNATGRQITTPAADMTLQERHALLTFAAQCCYRANQTPPYIVGINPEGWTELQDASPDLVSTTG